MTEARHPSKCIMQASPGKEAISHRRDSMGLITIECIAGKRDKHVGRATARGEAGASRGKAPGQVGRGAAAAC